MMGRASGAATGVDGETVGSFPTYEAAQKAVSRLIAAEVPARHIAIVGSGLRSIERVTGRLGYAAAARSGALNGMMLGMLFAFLFVLASPVVSLQAFVGVLFVGIAIGMLLSIVTYAFIRRRRDFASVMQVVADHYEVTVQPESIQRARTALGRQPLPERQAQPEPSPDEPPRYGERITPPAAEAQPAAPGTAGEAPGSVSADRDDA